MYYFNFLNATVVCILWQLLVCSKKNGLCFLVTVWVRNLCILHRSQSFFCRWCSQRQSKHQKSLLNPRCCGAKAHIRPATLAAAAVQRRQRQRRRRRCRRRHATTVFYNFLLLFPPLLILHSSTWLLLFKSET